MVGVTGHIVFATLLGPVVIIFIALGFATDYWVEVDVDRSKLTPIERTLSNSNQDMARLSHTRHKGILRECYPEEAADAFLDNAQNIVGDNCFYINFDDPSGSISSEYQRRMDLIRGVLACYVLGIVCIVLAFIIGLVLCFAKNPHVAHGSSILNFLGGLFILTAIVLFHATEYVEANKDGDDGESIFQNTWSENLLKATDSEFGYSYALTWVGTILAMCDGILYLLASRILRVNYKHFGGSETTSTYSSSDRHDVVKSVPEKEEIYDNYAYAGYPVPMFVEGYPSNIQNMPAYPAISYGNTIYKTDA